MVLKPGAVRHIPKKMKVPDLCRDKAYFKSTPELADFDIATEQAMLPGTVLDEFEFVGATQKIF